MVAAFFKSAIRMCYLHKKVRKKNKWMNFGALYGKNCDSLTDLKTKQNRGLHMT